MRSYVFRTSWVLKTPYPPRICAPAKDEVRLASKDAPTEVHPVAPDSKFSMLTTVGTMPAVESWGVSCHSSSGAVTSPMQPQAATRSGSPAARIWTRFMVLPPVRCGDGASDTVVTRTAGRDCAAGDAAGQVSRPTTWSWTGEGRTAQDAM